MNDIAVLNHAERVALADIDVSDPKLYQDDVWHPYFARLRREDPVHYCRQSLFGPYWAVTKYIIDRPRPRQHMSFGYGIHRCVGNRLAELQLRILWEEIMQRYPVIEVMGDAKRTYSNFIHGIRSLPVRIPA